MFGLSALARRFPRLAAFVRSWREQHIIRNVHNTDYPRRALLSYVLKPFDGRSDSDHAHILEARLMAETLRDLGYNVDVAHWNCRRTINYKSYALVLGMGEPVERAFDHPRRPPVITYASGSHPRFQNKASADRFDSILGEKLPRLRRSLRFSHEWPRSIERSEALLVVGNDATLATYAPYRMENLYAIPVPGRILFPEALPAENKNYAAAAQNFLFVGGPGMIHKGLDLLLAAFNDEGSGHLHICAALEHEPDFAKAYGRDLAGSRIHYHGFVDLRSERFKELLNACAFVILPSCAEGQSSGVVDAARHGLIPVVTREAGVDVGEEGFLIESLSAAAVKRQLAAAQALSETELRHRSEAVRARFNSENDPRVFTDRLRAAIIRHASSYERNS